MPETSSVLIIGLSTGPVWGCPDLSWGKGQSLDISLDGGKKELKNGQGKTVAIAYYDNKKTASYTVKICGATPENLARGTVLSVDGEQMILDKATLSKKNEDFAEYKLDLEQYEGIALTQSGTSSQQAG